MSLVHAFAKLVRELPDSKLAAMVRAAPDEAIAALVAEDLGHGVWKSKPPRAKPARPKASKREDATDNPKLDAVHKVLVTSDAVSKSEIVSKTQLSENEVAYALRALRKAGRAFSAGHAGAARWAVTQAAATKAAARGLE